MREFGGVHAPTILDRHDVRLRLAVENAPVVGPSFHHQGQCCKLGSTVVDLQAVEVLLDNQGRDVLRPVAPLLINRFQQVVGFDQDVTGAAGRVKQGEFFRI